MADADAAVPPPPPPPPGWGWRSIAAALVPSRCKLAAAAVTAIIYLILATDWVLFASLGTWRIGRVACGEGCATVASAYGVSNVAMVSLVVLGLVALVAAMCSIFGSCCNTEAMNAPSPNDLIAPGEQPVLCVLMLGMLALMGFVLVTIAGFLLKAFSPFMGLNTERSGSVIIDVSILSLLMLNCFIVLPALALFVWKRMLVIWQRI